MNSITSKNINPAVSPSSITRRTKRSKCSEQQECRRNRKKAKISEDEDQSPTVATFIMKLYEIISSCDDTIAAWSQTGNESFLIKDQETFVSSILPQFYGSKKFPSFVRQLNNYGFKKIRKDRVIRIADMKKREANYDRFYHQMFQEGRKDGLSQIQRLTTSGSSAAAASRSSWPKKEKEQRQGHEQCDEVAQEEITSLKEKITYLETYSKRLETMFQGILDQMTKQTNQGKIQYNESNRPEQSCRPLPPVVRHGNMLKDWEPQPHQQIVEDEENVAQEDAWKPYPYLPHVSEDEEQQQQQDSDDCELEQVLINEFI